MKDQPGKINSSQMEEFNERNYIQSMGFGPDYAPMLSDWNKTDNDSFGKPNGATKYNYAPRNDSKRLPGIRSKLTKSDPVVIRLMKKLEKKSKEIPAPDERAAEDLSKFPGYTRCGRLILINGVPIPTGKEQIKFFTILRWRPLFSPLAEMNLLYHRDPASISPADQYHFNIEKIIDPDRHEEFQLKTYHLIEYDARHCTDEALQSSLMYCAKTHYQNLKALQANNPALFMAVWLRDFDQIKVLARHKQLECLVKADPRALKLRNNRTRLMVGSAIMDEFERVFEVFGEIKHDHNVTWQAVETTLARSSSLQDLNPDASRTDLFIKGFSASTRVLHSTMNNPNGPSTSQSSSIYLSRNAVENSCCNKKKKTRIRWLDGPNGREMPALTYMGMEPQFLVTAAIINMVKCLNAFDGDFELRGKRDESREKKLSSGQLVSELAIVIASVISAATARTINAPIAGKITDIAWLELVLPTVIFNPDLRDEAEKLRIEDDQDPCTADCDPEATRSLHKSHYEKATLRADNIPNIGKPGWTQGFYFLAWINDKAEHAFLRKCCRFVKHSEKHSHKRHQYNVALSHINMPNGAAVTIDMIPTGLPRQHPVERIHDQFRTYFDEFQYPDLVPKKATRDQRARLNKFVGEAALQMPAVSPITLDPYLNEKLLLSRDPIKEAIAVQGAWQC